MEDPDHVVGLEGRKASRGKSDSGFVVDEVQDLDRAAVGELPGSRIQLPGLIGELGLKTDERGPRALVRLRSNQAVAFEDPPHGRDRGHAFDLADEVMGYGFRPGIVTRRDEVVSKL